MTENQPIKNSGNRPWYRRVRTYLGLLLILFLGFFGTLWIPSVQTVYVRWGLSQFSDRLGARFDVEGVHIRLNGSVELQGLCLLDQKNDTLLYAKTLKTQIKSWMGLQKSPHFSATYLDHALVRVRETSDKGDYNFDFFLEALSSKKKRTDSKSVPIFLEKIQGSHIRLEYHRFRGKNSGPILSQKVITFTETSFLAENWTIAKKIEGRVSQFSTEINRTEKIKNGYVELELETDRLWLKKVHLRTSTAIAKGSIQVSGSKKNQRIDARFDSLYIRNNALQKLVDVAVPFQQNALVKGSFVLENQSAKAKKLVVALDGKTAISGNFSVKNWNDIAQLQVGATGAKVNINPAQALARMNQNDLAKIVAPLGNIQFEGEADYRESSVKTDGYLNSNLGKITSKSEITWNNGFKIKGNLSTENLDLTPFLPENSGISHFTFQGNMNVAGKDLLSLKGPVQGALSEMEFQGKRFQLISMDGAFGEGFFHGKLQSADPGLQFLIQGNVALDPAKQISDVAFHATKIDLQKLGLSKKEEWVSGDFTFQGKGSSADDFIGTLMGKSLVYHRSNEVFTLPEMEIYSQLEGNNRSVGIQSTWLNASVTGQYPIMDLWKYANNLAEPHVPAYLDPIPHLPSASFDWKFWVKDPETIADLFRIRGWCASPFHGSGLVRSDVGRSLSRVLIPYVDAGGTRMKGGILVVNTDTSRMSISVQTDTITVNDTTVLTTANFNTFVHNDTLRFTSDLIRDPSKNQGNLEGMLVVFPDSNVLHLDQSSLTVNGDLWKFYQDEPIVFDRTGVTLHELGVKSFNQLVQISGKISDSPKDTVTFITQQFNLAQLNNFLKAFQIQVEGKSDIKVSASNYLKDPFLRGQIKIANLKVDTIRYGDIRFDADWMKLEKTVHIDGEIFNKETQSKLDVDGFVDFHESREELDVTARLSRTDARWLEKILAPDLYNIQGYADGFIQVYGTFDKPLLIGAVNIDSGSFVVDAMNVRYNTGNKPISILLTDESIDFNKVKLYDDFGGIAQVNGKVLHNYLRNTRLDLTLDIPEKKQNGEPNKVLVYDFPNYSPGDVFYGSAFATGFATIKGHISLIDFNVRAKSQDGTLLKIPLEETEYSSTADFMQFTVKDTLVNSSKKQRKVALEGVNFYLDLEATPDAEIHLIFDELAGDVIRGRGKGNLKMAYDKDEDFTLFGNYEISKGDYHFTWENIIDKKFDLVPGGTLVWSGDPYHAQMNLQAMYTQRTTLTNLVNTDYDQSRLQDTTRNLKNIRYPVQTILKMSGDLMKPDIGFEIKIPNLSPGDLASIKLKDINNNQQELNNQVFGLLMLGQFINNSNLALDVTGSFNTLGEMVSNQLSNLLSKYTKNLNIGLNYFGQNSGSSSNARRQVQVAMNTTLFNDRVILDGNLDFGSDFLRTQTNGQAIGGTFSIEYLIDEEGKFRIKAFNRLEDNLLVANAGSNYRQGLGISYSKEFNQFSDLLLSTKNFIRSQSIKRNKSKVLNPITTEINATANQ